MRAGVRPLSSRPLLPRVRTDALRYYGASGGSIFLTDQWIPLQGGKYPGVFALMCGGEVPSRPYAWDPANAALRSSNPLAAVAGSRGKGFAVTEKVVANAGHCEFDAHGEAVGIWTQNP